MRKSLVHITAIGLVIITIVSSFNTNQQNPKRRIAITFDDGSINNLGSYKLEEWNAMLLGHLKKHNLKSILFVAGQNKRSPKGKYLLSSWNDAGHYIANHTLTHPNFNSDKVTLEAFEQELLANDSVINRYSNYLRYFRFPYLKEGNTPEKVNGFRAFLKEKGYKNGHVSVDASDWYIDSRLVRKLRQNPKADVSGFKEYYKAHLLDRANYYDSLAQLITSRNVDHVLLLHHNLAAALFLDDLIQHFKHNGWEVINADLAFKDPIYNEEPTHVPAGESIIWALAKASGKFENALRYPAEDSQYEEPKMDQLGL